MIKSMTGFGNALRVLPDGRKLICNIRTVNHRYLDINVSLPDILLSYEKKIVQSVKDYFTRGKVDVSFRFERDILARHNLDIDLQSAEECYRLLGKLKKRLKLKGEIDISLLSNFKDIFISKQILDSPRIKLSNIVDKLLGVTIGQTQKMRELEGKRIYQDFKKRVKHIKTHLDSIEKRLDKNISLWRKKVREKLKNLDKRIEVDKNRLEQEVLFYALKSDITEECVRLRSHISEFEMSLKGNKACGKKINFILQEMAREANTLSVKTLSLDIQKRAIQLREEIEHLKEQAYNVE
ncbi:MAG: YicC family protein [Candidatus Cloacimonas sp. 4484_209]|nr:MAG: YicC family protein [Candidatus Cloacimonas sp. 4484_209]